MSKVIFTKKEFIKFLCQFHYVAMEECECIDPLKLRWNYLGSASQRQSSFYDLINDMVDACGLENKTYRLVVSLHKYHTLMTMTLKNSNYILWDLN